MTIVTAPDLYPRYSKWNGMVHAKRVRELTLMGLSAAIIAVDIGVKERTVCMIQRKIGLRRCRSRGEDDE